MIDIDREERWKEMACAILYASASNERDWAGHNEEPITEACEKAANFLADRWANYILVPHICPGGDGTIGFEWLSENPAASIKKIYAESMSDGTMRAYAVHRQRVGQDLFEKIAATDKQGVVERFLVGKLQIAKHENEVWHAAQA